MVRVQRFELWASWSQTRRATNCATPGNLLPYSLFAGSPKPRALPAALHPDIYFFGFWKFRYLWSKLWSNAILGYFSMGGQIPQTPTFQGLPAFWRCPSRIPARHSQTKRATNCATPGYLLFRFLEISLSVVKAVVKCNFGVLFNGRSDPAIARVARTLGVSVSLSSDTGTALPNHPRCQLCRTH